MGPVALKPVRLRRSRALREKAERRVLELWRVVR